MCWGVKSRVTIDPYKNINTFLHDDFQTQILIKASSKKYCFADRITDKTAFMYDVAKSIIKISCEFLK